MNALLARTGRWAVVAAVAAGLVVLAVLGLVLADDSDRGRAVQSCERGDLQCYELRYARLVSEAGPEPAFRVFRADFNRDPIVRARCHGLAHAIGRAAGERYGTIAEAYRRGDRFCAAGYYHGVLEAIVEGPERARALERPDEVCGGLGPNTRDQANCAHGLGHGFMVVRANDVPASLRLCDGLTDGFERGNCYDGVFMENVMAHGQMRQASRYLDPNRPLGLCGDLPARYRGSCLNRQVLYALEVTGGDFRTIFGVCRQIGAAAQPQCDRLLGEAAAELNISSQPSVPVQVRATAQICGLAPGAQARLRCVEGAVGYFVFHYDRATEAIAFCELLGSLRDPCARSAERLVRDG